MCVEKGRTVTFCETGGTTASKLTATIVVPYELYELYDWGKVPELYGTIRILHFAGDGK